MPSFCPAFVPPWRLAAGLGAFLLMTAYGAATPDKAVASGESPPPPQPFTNFTWVPDAVDAKLSPDGTVVGFLSHHGRTILSLLDLKQSKVSSVQLGDIASQDKEYRYFKMVADFMWAGKDRVIIQSIVPWNGTTGGLSSANLQGEDWIGLTGNSRLRQRRTEQSGTLLFDDMLHASERADGQLLLLEAPSDKDLQHPHVVAMDSRKGSYRTVVPNPGDVSAWLADQTTGEVVAAFFQRDQRLLLRARSAADAPWRDLTDLGLDWGKVSVVGIYAGRLYLLQPGETGHMAVYFVDLAAPDPHPKLVYEDREYDILSVDGRSLAGPGRPGPLLFEPGTGRLLCIRYMADGPRQIWLEPVLADLQRQLAAAAPELAHVPVNMDAAGKRLLVYSWSARNPGRYSLIELENGRMSTVLATWSGAKPDTMADMFPVKFPARDGLELHGYMTMPPGMKPMLRPAVVLLHDGPERRDVWEYSRMVQFLANRGYAVLQVNYRGSAGYGVRLREAGRAGLGGAMIDDVVDATRWAVEGKLIDPRRIAVMGEGFGGYLALAALAREPSLYRAGVGVSAITDWAWLEKNRDRSEVSLAYLYWSSALDFAGNPGGLERLKASDPVRQAGSIRAPVLLVGSDSDQLVPERQYALLRNALREQGKKVQVETYNFAAHGYLAGENGVDFLKRLEKFLAANLKAE